MTMELRTLGRTGVRVSPLCLGAMMFGGWGNTDQHECIRIIHRAIDAGINFIETADVYARGESEEVVGKALAGGLRENVVLATKAHGTMGDDPNEFGNSRRWIVREIDNSLGRLKTDWIDLYQIHRPELDTDIDETLGALTDLVRAGKVRYIGTDEAGLTLIEMALAFVINHPAVTAAITGPRTMSTSSPRSRRPTCTSRTTCSTGSTRSSRRG